MQFKVLGQLEIAIGSGRLALGGPRQEIVLAALLLSVNKVVSLDQLQEAIYEGDPPPTGRSQVQISISSLRRLLGPGDDGAIISRRAQGYVLRVDAGRIDAQQFEEHAAAAQAARQAGQLEQAVACYRDALRLWRGPALDGIDSQVIRAAASRLDEQRFTINEDRLMLELDLGRHHELVGELTELVAKYPLRERLRRHLMLALYRCDRAAEALEVYHDTRRIMLDELGIEPGKRLRQLEYAILNADPSLDLPGTALTIQPAVRWAPHMLPTDIADFTGRAVQLSRIQKHLTSRNDDDTPPAVPIVVIVGKGGVGKTSLAIHAAHQLADHFVDGQLFADVHGTTSHSVSPAHVLERFLRALGLPGAEIPDGQDERAELYRHALAAQKALVVLDDVSAENQVLPLLPGSDTAAVIITGRGRLAGLAGAIHIEADIFDADNSIQLLRRIAGAERVDAQSQAADAAAHHCGHLPLALRIAGARLSEHPHWDMQQLVDRLADETRRLDELRHGDMHVRASISLGYESIGKDARRLFRRLALLDRPAFSGWVSAALLDLPIIDGEHLLDDLVRAQLVEVTGGGSGVHTQYRFHELIRVFARERLSAEESPADREAALQRTLGALLHLAEQANRRYYGGDYLGLQSDAVRWPLPEDLANQLAGDPLSWYERERPALVSGVRQAAQAGLIELCWSLAISAVTLFESRVYLDDWQETHDIALEAARRAGHARGQAAMLYSIGSLNIAQQRFDPARQAFNTAADYFLEAGDDQGVALVTRHIAFIDRLTGRLHDAAKRYEQSLAVFRRHGDQMGTAYVLNGLAQVRLDLGDSETAMELLSDALRLSQAASCGRVEAQVLHRIGEASLQAGKFAEAVGAFDAALAITRRLGDPIGEAYALHGTGLGNLRLGKLGPAHDALHRAQELADGVGERMAEARACAGLSELALASGDLAEAVLLGQRASDAFGTLGAVIHQARVLVLLSTAHTMLGDPAAAGIALAQADALGTKLVDPHLSQTAALSPRGAAGGRGRRRDRRRAGGRGGIRTGDDPRADAGFGRCGRAERRRHAKGNRDGRDDEPPGPVRACQSAHLSSRSIRSRTLCNEYAWRVQLCPHHIAGSLRTAIRWGRPADSGSCNTECCSTITGRAAGPQTKAGVPGMGISMHILDGTYGKPAVGVSAHLAFADGNDWAAVADAESGSTGSIEEWESRRFARGIYRIVLDIDKYFAQLGGITAHPEVVIIFRIRENSFRAFITLAPYSYAIYSDSEMISAE